MENGPENDTCRREKAGTDRCVRHIQYKHVSHILGSSHRITKSRIRTSGGQTRVLGRIGCPVVGRLRDIKVNGTLLKFRTLRIVEASEVGVKSRKVVSLDFQVLVSPTSRFDFQLTYRASRVSINCTSTWFHQQSRCTTGSHILHISHNERDRDPRIERAERVPLGHPDRQMVG
jgi:hypothetical protein